MTIQRRRMVPDDCPLTRRAFETVLEVGVAGRSYEQAGSTMHADPSTLRTHMANALRALDVATPGEAIAVFAAKGWTGFVAAPFPPPRPLPTWLTPALQLYAAEFQKSHWPHEPSDQQRWRMVLALEEHRGEGEAG